MVGLHLNQTWRSAQVQCRTALPALQHMSVRLFLEVHHIALHPYHLALYGAGESGFIAWYEIKDKIAKNATVKKSATPRRLPAVACLCMSANHLHCLVCQPSQGGPIGRPGKPARPHSHLP